MSRRPDGQNPWSRLDFDFVSQPRNLKQRLGKTDPSRVADFYQLCPNHGHTLQTCSHCSHGGSFRASPLLWLTLAITCPQTVIGEDTQMAQ